MILLRATFVLAIVVIFALPPTAVDAAERPDQAQPRARIALIIDDLGYARRAGERAIALPGPVACAILPGTPRAIWLANHAYTHGKDVLLHLPLQAQNSYTAAEPGGLLLDMSQAEFSRSFLESIAAVPHVVGVNNHRGSLLTRHPGHMSWLMEEILQQGNLFFVDSYTTAASIALSVANEAGVPAVKRDVFLDPDQAPETVVREFARLKKLALKNGFALGIGHPYPATLALLEAELPKLRAAGIELVGIVEYIELKNTSNKTSRPGWPAADTGQP